MAAAVDAPTFLAWDSYLSGERQAQRGHPAAAVVHSARALELAESVDDRFLAGAAWHTTPTTAARPGDPAAGDHLPATDDHWHASGTWNQLWLAPTSAHRHARVATADTATWQFCWGGPLQPSGDTGLRCRLEPA